MRRYFKAFGLAMLAIIALFLSSCPAPAPNQTDEGSVAYQKPQAPRNVKATCGMDNQITLSWDPVENASLYIVYGVEGSEFGSEMQPYAYTSATTMTFQYVAPGTPVDTDADGTITIPRDFDKDEIYIFAVRSYVSYDTGDYLLSDNSDFAEGCFAPSTVEFHAVVTSDSVRLYWNCSNLFSLLSTGLEPKALYRTDFTISYTDTTTGESRKITRKDVGGSDPWLHADLRASKYFTHGHEYEFTIQLSVLDAAGASLAMVTSSPVDVTMTDSLIVSPIEEEMISASDGTVSKAIELEWTVPSWSLPVSRSNTYFQIDRRESDGEWETIIDEITTAMQSKAIEEAAQKYTFRDEDVEDGKRYEYRIYNAHVDAEGQMRICEEEPVTVEGSPFSPIAESLSAEWNPSETKDSGTATLKWNTASAELPEDLTWAIERTVWHGAKDQTAVDYITEGITSQESTSRKRRSSSIQFTATIKEILSECDKGCDNQIHTYSYAPVIIKGSNEVIYRFGSFEFNETPSLGEPIEHQIFRNLTASNNLVRKIRIEWNVMDDYKDKTISYQYAIDKAEYKDISVQQEGSISYADISVSDSTEHTIKLMATSGGTDAYESPSTVTGNALKDLDDIDLKASEGTSGESITLTWNGFTPVSEVKYCITTDSNEYPIDPSTGSATISEGLSNKGEKYTFKFVAKDRLGESIESKEAEGYILPEPKLTSVSKGDYNDRIVIEWEDLGDMVESYEVLRFASASMTGDYVSFVTAENTYEDKDAGIGTDYFYTVRSKKGNAVSTYEDEFKTVKNILPDLEQENVGYKFNPSRGTTIEVKELEDPNKSGYVAPYIQVAFPANKTCATYSIKSSESKFENEVIYDVSNLQAKGSIYTNDKSENEAGYIAYDEKTGIITINTDAGILDEDFEIKNLTIVGNSKNGDYQTDTNSVSTNNANRSPNTYDYINMFNSVVSEALTYADGQLGGQWSTEGGRQQKDYDGFSITTAMVWGTSGRQYGNLMMNGRHGLVYPISLESDSAVSTSSETGWPPYDLETIAPQESDSEIEISLKTDKDVFVDGKYLKVPGATIRVFNINVRKSETTATGTYWVMPDGGTEESIDFSEVGDIIPYHANIEWSI